MINDFLDSPQSFDPADDGTGDLASGAPTLLFSRRESDDHYFDVGRYTQANTTLRQAVARLAHVCAPSRIAIVNMLKEAGA
jgi:hypothetical protein